MSRLMIIHLMMITAFSLKLEVDARSPKKNKKTGTALVESNGNILIDDRVHNMASQSSPSSIPNVSCAAAPSQQDIVVNQSTFTSEMTLLRKTVEDLTSTVQSHTNSLSTNCPKK